MRAADIWYNQIEDMAISSDIFKAYDVRGVYPSEINADVAQLIAGASVQFLRARNIIVGEDGRLSSTELRAAVIEGANRAGCDVRYIGRCTTPLFYFAVNELGADGGIMITASHNPPEYNGLKIVGRSAVPIGLNNGLEIIRELARKGTENIVSAGRVVEDASIAGQYIRFLIKESGVKPGSIISPIVVDAGNGVAGITIQPLCEQLRIPFVPLRFRIDGSFSERSPDPSQPGALADLTRIIQCEQVILGLAFDGDADRLAVLDERGQLISAQFILVLLWHNASRWWHRPKVVYDLRFSRAVKQIFGKHGARSMAGHTNISNAMNYENATMGAEMSGHYYFRATNGMESPELAALKLIKHVQHGKKPLSELVAPLVKYAYFGEINIPLERMAQAFMFIDLLRSKYKDGKQDMLDGLTVEYPGWWFNIRPSNTEPVMRLVIEAINKELMEEKTNEIKAIVGLSR